MLWKASSRVVKRTLAVALALLCFCTHAQAESGPAEIRLVLQLTVDGLRYDMLTRNANRFGVGGFNYLLENATGYANAHFRHANTETIVGHATLATGAQPSVHGMTGNVWYDADAQSLSYNIEDAESPILPVRAEQLKGDQVDPSQRLARTQGRSPRTLLAETFADKLVLHTAGQARAFAVSGKDRSAVVMAGKAGKAFWMSSDSGDFVTSSWYYDAYPDWVADWNAKRKATQYADQQWTLLHDRESYLFSQMDDRPYETDLRGFGRTFPHRYGDGKNKLLFTQVIASPPGDALLADFAQSLVKSEKLGRSSRPDYLSVSFSGVDAVNHFFGPSSLEAEDMVRQLDRTLAGFLAFIGQEVGLEHTLVVLSADHGAAELPEYVAAQGYDSGRLTSDVVLARAVEICVARFGHDNLVRFYYRPYLYLDHDRLEEIGLDPVRVEHVLAEELTQTPGIHIAATRSTLESWPNQELFHQIRNNYHPARAGDIYIVQDPYWFNFDKGPVAAMHGSPWNYDTHVPLLFVGAGILPQTVYRRVQPADLAPTLSAMLEMSPPASAQGDPLVEVLVRH